MQKRKVRTPFSINHALVGVVITIVGFIGGALMNGFAIAENMATKPYVDHSFENAKKYTDDRSTAVLEKAIEHSDANRQLMMLQMEKMNTEVKTNQIEMTTKVDSILRSVQQMSDHAWDERRAQDRKRGRQTEN